MIATKSLVLEAVPGVLHGFGNRAHPIPLSLKESWESSKPVWKQVHGVAVARVGSAGQACGEVDALYSEASGVPIAVVTADCVPVLLARADGGAVAAVHAGWRGTRARILRRLWDELRSRGHRPGDWVAAVGPAIGPCCYEVSPELAADFAREFAEAGSGLAVPSERRLDLPAINRAELEALGLARVDLLRACTRCSAAPGGEPVYHSYRREGGGTRQYSAIQRS